MPPKKRKATEAPPEPEATRRVTRSSTTTNASVAQSSTESSKAGPKDWKTAKTSAKGNRKSKGAKPTPAITTEPDATEEAKSENFENDAASTHGKPESISIDSPLVKKPIESAMYNSSTPRTGPTLIFTHGAGGTLSAPAVVNFCTGFSAAHPVLVFQGSMNLASRVKGFHACIENVDKKKGDATHLVLGGRSMGARAAVMAAAEVLEQDEEATVELVLISYPLQGPKDVRDQILLSLPASVSVLFVIGDRDAMCPLDLLNDVRSKMEAKSQLVVVRGADHGMHTKPASVEQKLGEQTGTVAAAWLAGIVKEEVSYIGEDT